MSAPQKKARGFAAMTPERQREVASRGNAAQAAAGKRYRWDSASAKAAGRKGGQARKAGDAPVPSAT